MEEKSKLQLRPLRMAGYLVFLLADIFLFLFLRSYFFLLITLLLVIWPVLSCLGLNYLARRLRCEMGIGQKRVRLDDKVLLTLQLKNRSWWLALEAEWRLRIVNTFWDEQSESFLSMPVKPHGDEAVTLPLSFTELGHFRISGESLRLQDIFGLVYVTLPLSFVREADVIPEAEEGAEETVSGYLSGVSETEESREKGNDFAEVSDIREYIPGDRIRDIHWKLSAKKDILMVKERVAVAGSEMAVVLQFGEEKAIAEQVLIRTYLLGRALLEQRVPLCLLLWNQKMFGWEEYRCGSTEEIETAFCEIYRTAAALRNHEEWELYLKNSYPYLTGYLSIGSVDGEVQVVMHENV